MAVLTVEYFLSEKGERSYLKTRGMTISNQRVRLVLDDKSPFFARLCEYVDLSTLTFDCVYPGQKSLTVVGRSENPPIPYTIKLTNQGVYIESDLYFETEEECPELLEGLLQALDVEKQIVLAQEREKERLVSLPFETVISAHDRYFDSLSFSQLRKEIKEGSYNALDVRYNWTSRSVSELLDKLGWDLFEFGFDWPWDWLEQTYGRLSAYEIETEVYMAGDFARGQIEARTSGSRTFDKLGFSGSILKLPKKTAFDALKTYFEAQAQKRQDFLSEEGSNYLRHLAKDRKNYEHILEREILTKKYPSGYLFKQYNNQSYKPRNCPTPAEYAHLKHVTSTYPDLANPRFHWLEVYEQELVVWSGPVLVMLCPYGFDLLFADFRPEDFDFPLSSNQVPYNELEMAEANALAYKPLNSLSNNQNVSCETF